MRHMLATWQAFRAPSRNDVSLMETWVAHFASVAAMVRPMSNLTLLCNWEHHEDALATAFDRIKAIMFDSVVCTTKTLHCLVPDLFLILDRQYAYASWRQYLLGVRAHTLPAAIGSVDGARYMSFMKSVRAGLYYSISKGWPLVLGKTHISVSSAPSLRHISPIRLGGQPPDIPNTIGKVLDNIVAGSPYEA